jgi:hypothetical protein
MNDFESINELAQKDLSQAERGSRNLGKSGKRKLGRNKVGFLI